MHPRLLRKTLRFTLLGAALLLTSCNTQFASPPTTQQPERLAEELLNKLELASPGLPIANLASNQPLPQLRGVIEPQLRTLAVTPSGRVELRLLVVGVTNDDPGVQMMRSLLDTVGVPYDVLSASSETLTEERLVAANGDGRYQGIVLSDGGLAYFDGNSWTSAFDSDEWNLLWQYERDHKVRQVTLYAYPGTYPEDYGLRAVGSQDTTASDYPVTLTAAGRDVFTSVQPSATIPIRHAYTYLASAETGTTPLIQDAAGNTVVALAPAADGRERLVLTMAHNPYLVHSQLLGYDLVNWVTNGVHLGQRKHYLQVDVDDWFQHSDRWNPETLTITENAFRISASDALNAAEQQDALRSRFPLAGQFTFVHAFNGSQANLSAPASCDPNASSPDPLTSMTRCLAGQFYWLNHTYTEQDMDFTNYSTSANEIRRNTLVTLYLGMLSRGNYHPDSLLTGTHSGLGYYYDAAAGRFVERGLEHSNKNLLSAAYNSGVRYLGSNHSLESHRGSCPSCGRRHPLRSGIMLLPRYPTNVFYNLATPEEAVSEYNYIYGPGGVAPYWPRDLSYDEYVEAETTIALSHLLSGSPYPHFFHQANLYEYAPGRSLIFDWLERLAERYSTLSAAPLVSMRWSDLAKSVDRRTSFFESQARGVWDKTKNQVTIVAPRGGYVLATGIALGAQETYAGNLLSSRKFSRGETRTYNVVN